jgi:hypothetical protein
MSVLNSYREEDYDVQIEPGEHKLKIVRAEEKVFNSGNEGIKIELINKDKSKFYYHMIMNEFFNRNLTRFYDCFGIRRGNADLDSWVGKYGTAFIDKGKPNDSGKSYMEIKYLVVKQPPSAPAPSGESPMNEKRKKLVEEINALINSGDSQGPYFTESEKKQITNTVSRYGPYENGIKELEREKLRIAALLKEKKAGGSSDGWEDSSGGNGGEFKNDIPF